MQQHEQVKSRYLAGAIGALVWVVIVLLLYYWIHKPVTPAFAAAVGGALFDMATTALFVVAGAGLGRRLLRRLDRAAWSAPERLAADGLIGLGALSLLILLVGAVLLNPLSMILLLAALAGVIWRDCYDWLRDLVGWLRGGIPGKGWPRFLAMTALIMLLLGLILAVLPPTAWDVLTYHLAGPAEYVEHGRFYAVPDNHFLGFPQLVDTLFAGQLGLTGRLATGNLMSWAIGTLALLMVGGYAARRAGPVAGWVAVNVLLTATSFWLEMTWAYTDLMPVGLIVIGLAAADAWIEARQADPGNTRAGLGYLILIGVAAGFGMSTKYSVLWMAVGLGVLILWLVRREGWRSMLISGVIYGGVAAAVLLPWLVRNVILYGSPVYPLVFEAAEMDDLRQDWYDVPDSSLIDTGNAWMLPIFPVAATLLGIEGGVGFSATIGPLFLLLVPMLLFTWTTLQPDERQTTTRALVVGGTILLLWMISAAIGPRLSIQTRILFYLFGPLAVIAGIVAAALGRLPKKPFDLGFIIRAMVSLVFVLMLIEAAQIVTRHGLHAYFSGKDEYREDYLKDQLGWHYETMAHLNDLPDGTHIRFVWEPRYLYCERDRIRCQPDSLLDAWYYARRTLGSPAEIATAWQDADYLLVFEAGRDYEEDDNEMFEPDDWAAWDEFVAEYLIEVWRGANEDDDEIAYILYAWKE